MFTGEHLTVGVKIVPLSVDGLPAGLGVEVIGRQIVRLSVNVLPAFEQKKASSPQYSDLSQPPRA